MNRALAFAAIVYTALPPVFSHRPAAEAVTGLPMVARLVHVAPLSVLTHGKTFHVTTPSVASETL